MKKFVLTPLAARDLDGIWGQIAHDNISAADQVLNALEKAMGTLAKSPAIGHVREDLADRRHRFFLVYSYLIVYRPDHQPLEVIRVLHAARDIQSLLHMPPEEC